MGAGRYDPRISRLSPVRIAGETDLGGRNSSDKFLADALGKFSLQLQFTRFVGTVG